MKKSDEQIAREAAKAIWKQAGNECLRPCGFSYSDGTRCKCAYLRAARLALKMKGRKS